MTGPQEFQNYVVRAKKPNLNWSKQIFTTTLSSIKIQMQLAHPDENLTGQQEPAIHCFAYLGGSSDWLKLL